MKIKRVSAESAGVSCIVELAAGIANRPDEKRYSSTIEFALAELVRNEMRSLAQSDQLPIKGSSLLAIALKRVLGRLEAALTDNTVELQLSKYAARVQKSLTHSANEMRRLGVELSKSKKVAKLGETEALDLGTQEVVVRELGLRESIQGLLIELSTDEFELNLNAVRENSMWRVEGEWFPYEITIEEFTFVVDDDGSIFVSTANLPPQLREKARELIKTLAKLLFSNLQNLKS